jgi:hypothetical protein
MAENMCIKRNTTAVLPVRVDGVTYNNLVSVKAAFKSCNHIHSPILLVKEYKNGDSAFANTGATGFTINIVLDPSDTFKLEPGEAYMDVYPITKSSVINTGAPIRYDVIDTLLEEVI